MFKITKKLILSEGIKRIEVLAPSVAEKALPGQFVSVCPYEGDERIPLTIIDSDTRQKTITLIFREAGPTTKKLGELMINEEIFSVLGPLGKPSAIAKEGLVVCVATSIGVAQMLPICRAYQKAGNKVIGIIGARTKRALLCEPQMRIACEKLFVATEDGSYIRRGLATDVLKEVLKEQKVNSVYAIGSVELMQSVCAITKEKNIKTKVQINPVMVDCLGMCGSCRVKVGKEIVLACLEGTEFNGHLVDFEDLKIRINAYTVVPPLADEPRHFFLLKK